MINWIKYKLGLFYVTMIAKKMIKNSECTTCITPNFNFEGTEEAWYKRTGLCKDCQALHLEKIDD